MAKFLGAASLVAVALLGCFVGTEVEAQMAGYRKQPPQYPQTPQNPQTPQYPQNPQNPQTPQYPQNPQNPQTPQYPQTPQNPQKPQTPQNPQSPQNPQPYQPGQSWNPSNPYQPNYPSGLPLNYQGQSPPGGNQQTGNQNQLGNPSHQPNYPSGLPWNYQGQSPPGGNQQTGNQNQLGNPSHGGQYLKSDQAPQSPKIPQTPQNPFVSPPQYPLNCEVERNVRVPCGHTKITSSECEAINCCFDGQRCYFGKAVTVQCTKDAQFIVVVAKDATSPNIDLEGIFLLGEGPGCTHVDSNSEFAIYQFPVTACGSRIMEEPGVIIYENRMNSAYEVGVGPSGAITRDSRYELLFQCRYVGSSVETLVVEVQPIDTPPLPVAGLGPITVQMRLANGQCFTKGCNEANVAYSSFYTEADYPVSKVLRDPVYVEVQLLGKTDPFLVLTLGRCWATTSPQPHSLPQWDILIDGCPYSDDRYMSSLVSVDQSSGLDFPSHYRRFIFKMFTFVDPSSMQPLNEMVYIHCSTAVCYAAPGARCEPMCFRRKRDVKAVSQEKSEPKVVVSSGPVKMASAQQ